MNSVVSFFDRLQPFETLPMRVKNKALRMSRPTSWEILGLKRSILDSYLVADPLWNHILKNDPAFVDSIVRVLNSGELLMTFQESVNLVRLVRKTAYIAGDIAELGTYNGGSALLILQANESRKIVHLFDTFAGIPAVHATYDSVKVGSVRGWTLERVADRLKDFSELTRFHVGLFPATADTLDASAKYSLLNLDMDVYQGTKDALEYFYPRMSSGGVIICHDYQSQSCPGVKIAIDEFFESKPELPLELWHSQVAIVKH